MAQVKRVKKKVAKPSVKKAVKKTVTKEPKSEKIAPKGIFRCEICGEIYDTQVACCGMVTKDLMSDGCMSCKGCGFH